MNRVVCTKFWSIYLSLLRNSNNLIKVCTKFNIHSINNINILKGHSKSRIKIFNQEEYLKRIRRRKERSMDSGYSELLLCPIMLEPKNPRREHLSCLQINDGQ